MYINTYICGTTFKHYMQLTSLRSLAFATVVSSVCDCLHPYDRKTCKPAFFIVGSISVSFSLSFLFSLFLLIFLFFFFILVKLHQRIYACNSNNNSELL